MDESVNFTCLASGIFGESKPGLVPEAGVQAQQSVAKGLIESRFFQVLDESTSIERTV